jgi:serine/threonine protein kinase
MKTDGEEMKAEEKEEALRDFREETSILRTLRHPNICMLLGYSRTENFEVMISELMRCSLLDIFKSHIINNTKMPKRKQIIYAQQLAKGMNYLHQCKPPIIHRDLKPANLLIDGSGTLKISDFGLAKVRPDPKRKESESFRMTGETGSYRFMAPEVFRHEDYTETVDIYSFAMIFYYLLAGRPPWDQLSGLKAVIKAAMEADRPVVERSWDIQLSNMMQRCWDENPSARPSFAVIVKELHEYSKNALKLDLDNIAMTDETRSCCVIS